MRNAIYFTYDVEDAKLADVQYCITSDYPVIASRCIILVDTQRELG